MATFEAAAEDLVRRIQTLDGVIEEAHERLPELKQSLEALGQQLDADWIELAKEAAELVEKAQEEAGRLGQETQEAARALGAAEAAIRAAQGEADSALDAAQGSVVDFGDGVRQLEEPVESMAGDVGEAALHQLSQQAAEVEASLEQALAEARDFLQGEVRTSLSAIEDELADRFEEIRTTLMDECGNRLQSAFDDWSAKLTEVVDLVQQEGYARAQDHAREVVDYALTECARSHQEEFDRLAQVVDALEDVLGGLRDEIAECASDVGQEGQNALDQSQSETNEALAGMISALDAVKQLLASYTFVEM